MRKLNTVMLALGAAALCTSLRPAELAAQSRKGVGFNTLHLRTPGEYTSGSTFSSYSYGLGGLQSPSAGPGNSLLRSSIAGQASFALSRSGAFGGSSDAGLPLAPRGGGTVYTPVGSLGSQGGNFGGALRAGRDSLPQPNALLSAVKIHLDALDSDPNRTLKEEGGPITSLVPEEPSEYRNYMAEGEELFRNGQFLRAFEQFRMANYLASEDVASLLSLTHTRFALASYASASFYLQEALRFMPDLALVRLRPKAFYDSEKTYEANLERLEKHLQENPEDGNAQLLMAYFLWFDQDFPRALDFLAQAGRTVEDPDKAPGLAKAAKIFQRAMEASGYLQPSSQPASSTGPQPTAASGGTTGQPATSLPPEPAGQKPR